MKSYKSEQRISIAVTCIIFGFDGDQLKALLRGFDPEKSQWLLIGGFIGQFESAEEAASRVFRQHTGMINVYIEELCTFSALDRDPTARIISIVYFALTNIIGSQ